MSQPEIHPETMKLEEQLGAVESKVDLLSSKLDELKLINADSRLLTLESRVQTSIDLTDDIVGTANNLIASVDQRVSSTLGQADRVLNNADFMITTWLVIISLVIAVAGIAITWFLGRRQVEYVREAVNKVTAQLKADDEFRKEFINALVNHEGLKENIDYAINQAVKAKVEETNAKPDDVQELRDGLDIGDSE